MKHLMKKLKVLLAMLSERNEMERVHRVTLSFEFSASQITEGVVKNHNSPAFYTSLSFHMGRVIYRYRVNKRSESSE